MLEAILPDPPVQFEAVITPHRSLGQTGMRWVVGALCLSSAGLSAGLYLVGAWPVMGFSGVEILLAVWLLRRHAGGARATEMLLLSEAGLRIIRTDGAGRRWERRLDNAWLSASLVDRPGRSPALMVQQRGTQLEIALELGEDEKRDLAAALRGALYRQRHPSFDNAQLRPPPDPLI